MQRPLLGIVTELESVLGSSTELIFLCDIFLKGSPFLLSGVIETLAEREVFLPSAETAYE